MSNIATIIYLKDVKFNNSALPKIEPLTINGFLAKDLEFAMIPGDNALGLIDLSGNNHIVSMLGSPTFTLTGVQGNRTNGVVTDVYDRLSFTMLCAHRRIPPFNSADSYNRVFTYGCNYISSGSQITAGAGSLEYNPIADPNNSGYFKNRPRLQCMAKNSSNTNAYVYNYVDNPYGALRGFPSGQSAPIWWEMTAITVDADSAVQRMFWFPANVVYTYNSSGSDLNANSWKNRQILTDAGAPIPFTLFCPMPGSSTSYSGSSEVAACAYWNRALSVDEVQQQYVSLQRTLYAAKGIKFDWSY